ncbi:MAG: PfkB family carbohydrate kinase [Tannerella sp.]|jgi:sugar/nucleoside kinase (ribokinase family)|nr:PfkB family carbohydrate kinase [Tannerella sp.]
MRHELCCIGHITLDKVTTPQKTVYMPGGTSFYVSHAINNFSDIDYALVTAVGERERRVPETMRSQGIHVTVLPSRHSVYFENIYGENTDERQQYVRAKADPFSVEQLRDVESEIFHLGALLADDFSEDVVRHIAGRGLVSVDSQGYLREVCDSHVHATDWHNKLEALKYVHFLKANEHEMEVLTGYRDAQKAARKLHEWSVKEVILTFGGMGSLIYDGDRFYRIPAYKPRNVVDATGCGDTYMAGYLYKRVKGASIEEAGNFAAALSTLKIEHSGPVRACAEEVSNVLKNNSRY